MNTRIFVSYTFRDATIDNDQLTFARDYLSLFGIVFVDHLSKPTGWHPQLRIFWQLIRCHLVVVIDSRRAYRSPWVLLELFVARLTLTPIVRIPASLIEAGHNNALHRSREAGRIQMDNHSSRPGDC